MRISNCNVGPKESHMMIAFLGILPWANCGVNIRGSSSAAKYVQERPETSDGPHGACCDGEKISSITKGNEIQSKSSQYHNLIAKFKESYEIEIYKCAVSSRLLPFLS
jgi:hypothetical protein